MLSKLKPIGNAAEKTARELYSHAKAFQHYPFGYWTWPERGVPHPKHAQNPRPILLVHGVIHNRSAFFPLRKKMEEWRWQNIFTLNYSTFHGSLTGMVEDLATRVDKILYETKSPQIDIVSHSLGGIISRYYMSIGLGRGRVKELITLGTAHHGTKSSVLLKLVLGGSLYRDLRRQSYFLKTLNETSLPRDSRITSVYSQHDKIVWPYVGSMVEGRPAESYVNREVDSAGHISLLYDDEVFAIVKEILS